MGRTLYEVAEKRREENERREKKAGMVRKNGGLCGGLFHPVPSDYRRRRFSKYSGIKAGGDEVG